MPAPPEHFEIPLTGGLDTGSAERHVEPPNLLVADNIDYDEAGRIRKRVGYEDVPEFLDAPYFWLHERGGNLLANSDDGIVVRDDAGGIFSYRVSTTSDVPVSRVAATVARESTFADYVTSGGYFVALSLNSANDNLFLYFGVDSTSVVLGEDLISSTAKAARLLITGTTAVLVYIEGTSLKAGTIDMTVAPVDFSTATTIRTDVHATDKYLDAAMLSSTEFVLCYRTNSGSTIRTERVTTATLVTAGNRTDTFAGTLRAVGVYYSAAETNGVTIIADSSNGVVAKHWDSALGGSASSTVDAANNAANNVAACDGTVSGRIMIWSDWVSGTFLSGNQIYTQEVTADETTGAPVGGKSTFYNVALAAKPFIENSNRHAPVVYDNDDDNERMILLLNPVEVRRIVGRALYLTAHGTPPQGQLGSTGSPASSRYVSAVVSRARIVADDTVHTGVLTSLSLVEWGFNAAEKHMAVNYGRSVFVPNAVSFGTDLVHDVYHGLLHSPDVFLAATTGGAMSLGTYTYAVVYQRMDFQGQIHWSPPSILENVTLSGGQSAVTVTVRIPLGETSTSNLLPPQALVFRSQVDDSSVLNLVSTAELNTAQATQSISDTSSDATIADNEILYTNGDAQLSRHMAPPCRYATVHDQRLWVISDDDGSIWYSHRRIDPEGVGFHPSLSIDSAVGGSWPIALASLGDARLAVLWPDRIGVIYGEGPNAAGVGGSYTDPLPVQSAAFCDEPRSVAATHLGVVFQSTTAGLWLLGLDLSVRHIGGPVSDYETDTCVKSVSLEDQTEIAFVTVSGSDTRVLYWNYVQNKWSTQLIGSKAAVSATAYKGRLALLFDDSDIWHAWARSDGRYDFGGTAGVNGSYAPWSIETAWIKANGKQGQGWLHRIYALLERKSDAGLRVEAAYNYGSYTERADFTDAELSATGPLHVELEPKTADIEAVKLKFLERVDGVNVTSEGLALDSIRLEIAREPKQHRRIHQALKKGLATI